MRMPPPRRKQTRSFCKSYYLCPQILPPTLRFMPAKTPQTLQTPQTLETLEMQQRPAAPLESHPLPPFLPPNATLLMLGTFPPPRERWSMEFYYPNFQNDMWRIFGLVFFDDKDFFVTRSQASLSARPQAHAASKHFDRSRLEEFLSQKGIAVADTALKVKRLKNNASDQFLEITETLDLAATLARLPLCHTISTAGEKATSALLSITGSPPPPLGGFVELNYAARTLRHFRMPSSSRAYPKPLPEKARVYAAVFRSLGFL